MVSEPGAASVAELRVGQCAPEPTPGARCNIEAMRRCLSVGAVALAAAAHVPAAAQAQGTGIRVGVARIAFVGDVPQARRQLFAQRLTEGLAVARFEVLAGKGETAC